MRVSRGGGGGHVVGGRAGDGFFIAPPMVVPYEATNVGVELKGVIGSSVEIIEALAERCAGRESP